MTPPAEMLTATGDPAPGSILKVQQNLARMQLFNDYVPNFGHSRIINAYMLLSEPDTSDPGLTSGLNILEGNLTVVVEDEFNGFVVPALKPLVIS